MKESQLTSESGIPSVANQKLSTGWFEKAGKRCALCIACLCLTLMFGLREATAQGGTTPEYTIYQAEELASSTATHTAVSLPYNSMSNATTYNIAATTAGITISKGATGNLSGADGVIAFELTKTGGGRLDAGTYDFTITMTGLGCPSEEHSFQVVILGKPVLDPFEGTSPVCNVAGNLAATGKITAGTGAKIVYIWTAAIKTTLTSEEAAKVNFTANSSAETDYASGVSITGTIVNGLDKAVEITYTATPIAYYTSNENTKVIGESKEWTVTVQPTATLTSATEMLAICSGSNATYTATSNVTGATFSWTRAAVSGITEAAGTGTGNIDEKLTNTTTAPITVTYIYKVKASDACENATTFPVTVVVNPTPVLTSPLTIAAVCSGETVNYTPTSAVTGITYNWNRAAITGITETEKSGTDAISEALHNTSTAPIVVTYTYTLSANSCPNTQDVTVTIQPALDLKLSTQAETICSDTKTNVTITSSLTGGENKIEWTATKSTGDGSNISGFSAQTKIDYTSGTKIEQQLTNSGTTAGTVTYVVKQTFNGCSTTETYVVTVNPTLTINAVQEQIVCSEDATATITFGSNVTSPTVSYAWEFEYDPTELTVVGGTITDIAGGKKKASGTGDFTLTKVTRAENATTAVTVAVKVTGTIGTSDCTATQTFPVTVNPKPKFKLGVK